MNQSIAKQTGKSIVRNVFYGSLTWILPLGLGFVATPIIVRTLGNNDYGIYALVLGFIGYSFTFNFGRPITKYIAEFRATGESEKISDVISASFFLNVGIGLAGVVAICSLASWLVRIVFQIEPAAQQKTVIALYITSGVIFVTMCNQVLSGVLQGLQRFDVYSKILTVNNIALIGGNVILAYSGFGLLELLAWNFVILVIFCVIFGYAAKRLLPEFAIRVLFRGKTLRMVSRYSSGIIIYQIVAYALLLFERGWITQRLGTESLTYYVVPMSLGLQLQGFISSLLLVVFPLASELKNDRARLLSLYTKATKIISLLVVFLVTSLVIHSNLFLRLWMGEEFANRSSSLLTIHIIGFGLLSIMSISWQLTEGLGYPGFNAAIIGICAVVGISLMVLLTDDYGNAGVAAARLTGFATIFFSIFIVEKWFFEKVQARFWFGLVINLVIAAISAGLIEYTTILFLPLSWGALLTSVFLGGLTYCLILWLLDFVTADEKLLVRGIMSR